mgnify:CR=1 FL=1
MRVLCRKTGGGPVELSSIHEATLGPRGDVGHQQYKTIPLPALGKGKTFSLSE